MVVAGNLQSKADDVMECVIQAEMERRTDERRNVAGAAQARKGNTREAVELRDLSCTGARIKALAPLRTGLSIWLQIGSLSAISATVVWTSKFEAGCEFTTPLHPAVFESLSNSLSS